ncbi:MAG: class I SAM-dependent methyltransferase [Chloroflexota bacterium]
MNSLTDPKVKRKLSHLLSESGRDLPNIAKGFLRSFGRSLEPKDMADAYIAISAEQGELLYTLARINGAKKIVEFGASFGISAIYLGAAARDNGGQMITTEIEPNKIETARRNITAAGLADTVTLLAGNALETLRDVSGDIDLLFMDGWHDIYLPLIEMLEPQFRTGTVVATDNAGFRSARPFLNYLHTSGKYVSHRLKTDKGALEFSCYLL